MIRSVYRVGVLALLTSVAAGCQSGAPVKSIDEPLYYEKMFPPYVAGIKPKNIAIVGAGTAGFSAAWNLRRLGHNVRVFDRMRFDLKGGNVNTVPVSVKDRVNPSITYPRWGDAGVNDFNTKTYRYMTFMYDYLGVQHKPLEDSAMWGNTTGLFYQVDGNPNKSLPQYKGSSQLTAQQLLSLQNDSDNFFRYGYKVATDIRFAEWTVDQWIAYKRGTTINGLNCATLNDCYNFSDTFVNDNLKARISNMYFSDENEPGAMPIRGVLYYYILQEGLNPTGLPKPDRRYYVGGAINIINKFYNATIDPNAVFPEVPAGATSGLPVSYQWCATVDSVDVSTSSKSVTYHSDAGTDAYYNWPTGCTPGGTVTESGFDYVIVAANLLGTQQILKNSGGGRVPQAIIDAIAPVTGDHAQAVIHEYDGAATNSTLLNINYERTYNILAYDNYVNTFTNPNPPPVFRPYTITYIENRHQADAQSGIVNPSFYTSLNPKKAPPSQYVLTRTDNGQPASNIPSYHQYMTAQTLLAQRKILGDRYNYPTPLQGTNGLYLGGGWVRGAGLQEETFIHAVQIAAQINAEVSGQNGFIDQHIYDYTPGAARYAPLYIAQIAYTADTYSGVYRGGNAVYGNSAYCRQSFNFNTQAGHSYHISDCPADNGSVSGDTYLSVYRPDGSLCCVNDDALGACGLGSACDCTATTDGNMTLCAGTYYGAALATWDYRVTDTWSSSSSNIGVQSCETVNLLANSTYTISCPSYTGLPYIVPQYGSSITCSGGPLCFGGVPLTCTANADNPLTLCGSSLLFGSSSSWNVSVQAQSAANASQTLPTLQNAFDLPQQGGMGGSVCTDSARTCPDGYVATALNVWEGSWAFKPSFTCSKINYDGTNPPTLGPTVIQDNSCGYNSGAQSTYDCNTGSNVPAVIAGQRIWIDPYYNWVYRVRPICRRLTDGVTFNPDSFGAGQYEASCPPDTEVYNFNARNGTVTDRIGFVCSDSVPLFPKSSCMGYCGQASPSGCSCAPGCTTNCCPDYNLFCTGESCSGTNPSDYCYYLAGSGQSCNSACASHGGYNYDPNVFYTGSSGTLGNCNAVLQSWGQFGTPISLAGLPPSGCEYVSGLNIQVIGATTDEYSATGGMSRVCSCLK